VEKEGKRKTKNENLKKYAFTITMTSFTRYVSETETTHFSHIPIPQPILCSGEKKDVTVTKTYFVDPGCTPVLITDRVDMKMPKFEEKLLNDLRIEYSIPENFLELIRDLENVQIMPWEEFSTKDDFSEMTAGLPKIVRYCVEFTGKSVQFRLVVQAQSQDYTPAPVVFGCRCWVENRPLRPRMSDSERYFLLHLAFLSGLPHFSDYFSWIESPTRCGSFNLSKEGSVNQKTLRLLFKLAKEKY